MQSQKFERLLPSFVGAKRELILKNSDNKILSGTIAVKDIQA